MNGKLFPAIVVAFSAAISSSAVAQPRYDSLADTPFEGGYPTHGGIKALQDELFFQRAVQSYIWALPALNMVAMKEGAEKTFGSGYNVLAIWKDRLSAKTLVTTPDSDVIYAMGFLDLARDGPMVIEVPPGLQGILDDFFSVRSARSVRSMGVNGAGMSACLAPTTARAPSIWCCRPTIRGKFRRDTSRSARAPMG
jgi:hypothetical protein